jgi:hypothetical protein
MEMRLKLVQFGVSGLEDVRTLCTRWQAVLDLLTQETGSNPELEAWRQVGVEVEWRRPGEEVFLNFLAPPALLDRFLDDLREQGLTFSEQQVIPWLVVRCRLIAPTLQ